MRGMVLAAGFGTRLRPLTDELPKPAVPVANRPLAWFAMDFLARNGVGEVAINTHHLAGELRTMLEPHVPEGVQLRFVHEPAILGTGGGIGNAWRPMDGEAFVVVNGDLVFGPDLGAALALHQRLDAVATMVVRQVPDPDRWGAVEVDPEGRVRRILGRPKTAPTGPDGAIKYMFAGVQVLHPRAWEDLPAKGCVIRESYLRWLERGEVVAAVVDDSPWMELGTPWAYLEANCALAEGRVRWPGIFPGPQSVIGDTEAEVAGDADVRVAVLGAGSRVGPGVRLRRAVLWPGARVVEDACDVIVTGTTTLAVGEQPQDADS